jgi:two-component system alkaline phosphatase synthesis response regulator PhoP
MRLRLLLVEDEPGLRVTVRDLLASEGYEVETADDGDDGFTKAASGKFDLIVLDVMLPRRSGFEVCRELRQRGLDMAVLMLTAKSQVVDRVVGLKLGADDYLTKPFEPVELLARVEALLRRVKRNGSVPVRCFRFAQVEVDFERAEVRKRGELVYLAGKELQLLRYLIDRRGKVVPREELLQQVWEYSGAVASRTLDVHVAWLRQKLEDNPQNPVHIQTIRGKGYRFTP